MVSRRTLLAAPLLLLAAPALAQDPLPPACTPAARERAAAQRGLRCRHCSSYEVVPTGPERYTCCHCGRAAAFAGFVHRR